MNTSKTVAILAHLLVFLACGSASAADTILCVGDSITLGYGGTISYPSYLQASVGGNATVVNAGKLGETTSGGVARINSLVKTYKPKYTLIMEGANDSIWGVSPSTVKFNLARMVSTAQYYSSVAIISTITPDTRKTDSGGALILSYNSAIAQLASEAGVALVDSYSNVVGNWANLNYDGLHPNNAGYQIIANGFNAALPYSGSDGGGGGCFIATAAFGSALQPQVALLRQFRDQMLLPHAAGQAFVKLYYTYSPPLADFIAAHDGLRAVVRFCLYPVIGVAYCLMNYPLLLLLGVAIGLGLTTAVVMKKRKTQLLPA